MEISRKKFLALGAAGAAAAFVRPARGELVETLREWHQADFRKAISRPAKYRQVYDITQIGNGVFLNNIKNSLNGFQFGFGFAPGEFNIIAALHGNANLLNFDDAMWKKYQLGAYASVKDPQTGAPATRNVFYASTADAGDKHPDSEKSIYQDHSMQGLMRRGVHFLLCHTATEEQSRKLKKKLGLSEAPEAIVKDLLAHTVPGAIVVPSMVATVAVLQIDHHFSYITVA